VLCVGARDELKLPPLPCAAANEGQSKLLQAAGED
jgi:hypothetical protein